jgi:anti-anti-sigma factor
MGNDTFREESNKAFETAKLTSYWLYLAGIPEAIEYGKLIGLEDGVDPEVIPYSKDMCFLNPIIHEIRYTSVNYYVRNSGCKNVLDIACGYSPRGMQLAKEGYHYVGADLPVVADELEPIARKAGLDNLEYVGADATNYESLKAAADKLDGPICIVVEGLGMYLTKAEAATVRDNIARIMSEHEGSTYITPDPGNGYLFFDCITANYPPERMREVFGMLFTMYNWASNGGITMETDKRPLEEDAKMFKESGLDAKMSPLRPDNPQLLSFSKLAPEVTAKIREALMHPFTFVSTLSPDYVVKEGNDNDFNIESNIEGDTLFVKVSGRLDVLSSPKLLECFESNKEKVKEVEVDCKGLTYLSSSGNRVFHLIRKELSDPDKLRVINLSEELEKQSQDDEIIQHM